MSSSFVQNIRASITRRFLRRIKRATHRMSSPRVVEIESGRVLVIAPHMDDEIIPCGGALLLHRLRQSPIRIVFATDGSANLADAVLASKLRQTRSAEARAVSDYVGFDEIVELGFTDGQLTRHEDALAATLQEHIESFKPTVIFCPFPTDAHGDHMACAWALAAATSRSKWVGEIFAFEVWTTLWPNALVDIVAVAERKDHAIRLYESQMADRDYARATLGLNSYRGLARGLDYAEAYYVCSASEFGQLAAQLDRV
jgi:LmbE family N-acetylglucosaminyl deacetylase